MWYNAIMDKKDFPKEEMEREPASVVLSRFLEKEGITLTVSPLSSGTVAVGDGSVLIKPPSINAKYS